MDRHEPEQLNMPEVSEEFTLEDIIREFGGTPSSPPNRPASGDTLIFTPVPTSAPEPSPNAPVRISALKPVAVKPLPADPPVPVTAPPEPSAPKKEAEQTPPPKRTQEAAPPEFSSPAEDGQTLFDRYRKGSVFQILRCLLLYLLGFFALFLLCYTSLECDFFPGVSKYLGYLVIGCFSLTVLLSYEVFVHALSTLFRRHLSLSVLSIPISILGVLHGISARDSESLLYCLLPVLILIYLQYALRMERSAMIYTLHTAAGLSSPVGIYDAPQKNTKNGTLRCAPADMEDYYQKLLEPDGPQQVLEFYTLCILPLSLLLALILRIFVQSPFVFTWLLLLLGATPWAGALCYYRPFCVLARRLSKLGGALCGWHSAKTFGKKHTIILRDEDLFPKKDISSGGMKLYHGHQAPLVIAYAYAILEAAESPLSELFLQLLESHSGKHLTATNYRFYENNGIGGEVGGNNILLGTLSFCKSMGVFMPEGLRVKQAVYVSVNGELAGIFAIQYHPNPASKTGLKGLLSGSSYSVVIAARDFLITPELLAAKYRLPTDSITFPPYPSRIRLSELDPNQPVTQGALIGKNTFGAFASTVAAGHSLRTTARFILFCALLAGVVGLLLCSLLLLWGSASVASPLHLAIYHLVWALLPGLLSDIMLKF